MTINSHNTSIIAWNKWIFLKFKASIPYHTCCKTEGLIFWGSSDIVFFLFIQMWPNSIQSSMIRILWFCTFHVQGISKLTTKLGYNILLTGVRTYWRRLSEPLSTLDVPSNFPAELIMCDQGLVGTSLMAELRYSWSIFAKDKQCPSDLVTDFTV
jgi:hypothetical protein